MFGKLRNIASCEEKDLHLIEEGNHRTRDTVGQSRVNCTEKEMEDVEQVGKGQNLSLVVDV